MFSPATVIFLALLDTVTEPAPPVRAIDVLVGGTSDTLRTDKSCGRMTSFRERISYTPLLPKTTNLLLRGTIAIGLPTKDISR